MKIKIIICLIGLISIINTTNAQSYSSGISVVMDGYIINLGGEILFQPCEDSTRSVWNALDNRSFSIWCNAFNDQYCDAIAHIGDSVVVKWSIPGEKDLLSVIRFSYFYCSLDINMQFLATSENDFYIYKNPKYEIWYNDKKYPLKGFYIREKVRKIIPKDRKTLLLIYKYYKEKNYTIPEWLKILFNK